MSDVVELPGRHFSTAQNPVFFGTDCAVSVRTLTQPFEQIRDLLSDRPLRRPPRQRPL